MASNSQHKNSKLSIERAEALQANLYRAADLALQRAIETDQVTPALLTSINKMLSDANVQPIAEDVQHPLWSLADSMESLTFLDRD